MADDLRHRYAKAIDRLRWNSEAVSSPGLEAAALSIADAVLAVRDSEVETLRSRAETAEAAIARIRDLADRWGITDPGARDEILDAVEGCVDTPKRRPMPAPPKETPNA